MIELTIDGKKIRAEKGSTILQAALKNGIHIPHLCYDKRLVPYGGCRVCVVEIEGERKLEASCATLASDGMVVWTNTPKVRKIRQSVIELMLVHHPLDCPVCDKAGECALQDLAFQYGKPSGRFVRERKHAPPDARGPLVELTANRCILCGKCVRICAEHQGRGALGLIGRGFPTVVQPAFGEPQECDCCGQCIDVCPTGAILGKPHKFKARQWLVEERDTICPFCSCGCTLTIGIRNGKIVKSRGKEDSGLNEGNLCGRGRFGFDYIYSDNRLLTPMIRKEGELVPVSWKDALDYVGERLKAAITAHGPSSVGAIASPRCTNEDNYILQKFMREIIGSGNIDSSATFGYGVVEKAWEKAFGLSGHQIDLKSPLTKEVILIIESDLSSTHPFFGLNILKAAREGSKIIVADSRQTKLARHGTQWVKIKQGTAIAFLNGIMNVIIERGLFDNERVSKIQGFSELEEALQGYTPEQVSKVTGISEEELIEAAESLAKARTRMISLSLGASENAKGLNTVLAATNLIHLLGENPDALQIPAESSNTFGLYQMGVRPDAGPMYQQLWHRTISSGKDLFEMLYESYYPQLNRFRGADKDLTELYGQLKSLSALYIMGADPVVTFPDSSKITERLKSLDLLIVQDIAFTETARLAHVVLPASAWAERDGTLTNSEGIIQSVAKIVDPPGQARPDWEILRDIAKAIGKDLGIETRADISREYLRLWHTISNRKNAPGDLHLATRAFNPTHYTFGEETDSQYPLTMIVRDLLQHSGSMSTRSRSLDLVVPETRIEISEKDAELLGVSDNSLVRVTSRRGTMYVKAAVSCDVPDGTVYVPAHFPHGGVNTITHTSVNGGISIDAVRVETA